MSDLDRLIRRAWPVLREAIRTGRTVTYGELAKRVGRPLTPRAVHKQLLNDLSDRCRAAGLPNLAALVVRKATGTPGGGWSGVRSGGTIDWADALADCLHFPWPDAIDEQLLMQTPISTKRRTRRRVRA
jgi:hypothetical protein